MPPPKPPRTRSISPSAFLEESVEIEGAVDEYGELDIQGTEEEESNSGENLGAVNCRLQSRLFS